MEFIVIFGPPAAGKMTVGLELEKLTGYKLFHNHMVVEVIHHFFDFGEGPFWQLVGEFRSRIFQAVGASGAPGLIFTYVWALDQESDRQELERYCALVGVPIEEVFFVELVCPQEVRLQRNRGELRLMHKASKRNIAQSEGFLLEADRNYRLNSAGDFPYPRRHIRVENGELTPEEAAGRIFSALEALR